MTYQGWIVAEAKPVTRRGVRIYLVAAAEADQAVALVEKKIANSVELTVRGTAPEAHLERRRMKPGDVVEITRF